MGRPERPLSGKTALVTGVSRRRGIGFAVARRLAEDGASVFVGHYAPHDAAQPWGADDLDAVRAQLREALTEGAVFGDLSLDLGERDAPAQLVEAARSLTGSLDILVCNQAMSGSDGSVFDADPDMLDLHWRVNARATILMTAAYARAFTGLATGLGVAPGERVQARARDEHETGRVIWMTSGQARPMPGEVAYAASKAALAGLTPTAAAELLPFGIVLNTVNPGPVNTGYLDADTTDRPDGVLDQVLRLMPLGRFGQPDDVARIVAWLASDEAHWVAGQVFTSDGGFTLR